MDKLKNIDFAAGLVFLLGLLVELGALLELVPSLFATLPPWVPMGIGVAGAFGRFMLGGKGAKGELDGEAIKGELDGEAIAKLAAALAPKDEEGDPQ